MFLSPLDFQFSLFLCRKKSLSGQMWCNPSTKEAEVGESEVQGQPGLHRETLLQNNKNKKSLAAFLSFRIHCFYSGAL
jgi:hypothetical protein